MDLLSNPFYVLGVSPRDDRRRIVEAADERSVRTTEQDVTKARADLTNPRKRLSAEVAWLPGVGPKRATEILSKLERSGTELINVGNIAPITRANVLAAGAVRLHASSADDVVPWVVELARVCEGIVPEEVRALINQERVVAGFPEVTDLPFVESEIQDRRRHFGQALATALKSLSHDERVRCVTLAVVADTDGGKEAASVLIDDLVDSYEVEVQATLDAGVKEIETLVEKARTDAGSGQPYAVLAQDVQAISAAVKAWDVVAQPIQLSTRGRGLDHPASKHVALLVRSLAIDLFNEHDRVGLAKKLTGLLQEVFAEVVDVAELTAADASFLAGVTEQRRLDRMIGPLVHLCKTAIQSAEANPEVADAEAQRVVDEGGALLAKLRSEEVPAEALTAAHDRIALTAMSCAIEYANKTEKWRTSVGLLESALLLAMSDDAKGRINANLAIARKNNLLYGDLTPIESAPSLRTVNGIGFALYGSTDHEPELKSYLSTYYFVFFFIPIFPIRRYRVIPTEGGYRFLGKAPLRQGDKVHLGLALAVIAFLVLLMASDSKPRTAYRTPASASTRGSSYSTGSSYLRPSLSNLAREIEDGKARASELEREITYLDQQLEAKQRSAEMYRAAGMTEAYNNEVPSYNLLLSRRNRLYQEYSRLVDEVNGNVERYNSLNGSR